MIWGAHVEAVIHREQNNHKIYKTFKLPRSISVSQALSSPSASDVTWNGIMLGTLLGDKDAVDAAALFKKWQPLIAIFAMPVSTPRHQQNLWLVSIRSGGTTVYTKKKFTLSHHAIGGVTSTVWQFVHLSRRSELGDLPMQAIMMAPQFSRPLQTALQDTIGGTKLKSVVFEKTSTVAPLKGCSILGYASSDKRGFRKPVYDSTGSAPDMGALSSEERMIWVSADSVYGKGTKVIRQIESSELFAIWDYEGKYESKNWSFRMRNSVLNARLSSPPAKMIRSLLFVAGETVLSHIHPPAALLESRLDLLPGKTSDVPFNPMEEATETRVKAAQADDAEVDLSQWPYPNETPRIAWARNVLRRLVAKWWILHQEKLAMRWLEDMGSEATSEDIDAINDCMRHVKGCTYWTWSRGSRILFYKFPPEWRNDFRDGVPFWKLTKPPNGFMRNMKAPSREAELLTRLKIFKLKFQYYLDSAKTTLLCPRFTVPKMVADDGTITDVRCVWDCTINGLNATLYTPGFMLPTALDAEDQVVKWLSVKVGEHLRRGSPVTDYSTQEASSFIKTTQGDIDVGQHFNNFRVHPVDQHCLGVRYTYTNNQKGAVEREAFFRFNCAPFGAAPSPYLCCQGESRIIEYCKGDPDDTTNEFQFKTCHLNLPFSKTYDPSLPEVMLLREDGELATTEVTFVDDIRAAGRCKKGEYDHARAGCKQLKSRMNSVANQADDRKFRQPVERAGAWIGLIIHTDTPFPHKSTTAKKWNKFKDGLLAIREAHTSGGGFIDTGKLRSVAGLGVNVTDVYPNGRCYLKGFFNAVEAWRFGRDIDGWRLTELMVEAATLDRNEIRALEFKKGYPAVTHITSELVAHVDALLYLFASEAPLMVPLRPTEAHKLRYVVGDASAEGFSIVTQYPDMKLECRDGLWDTVFAKGGSNLREAQNFANHCLEQIRSGKHDGCSLWAGTDNAVWSAVWHKGMSSVKHLYNLAVELRVECQKHEVFFHLFHISGNRMIATGVDGRSRGDFDAGVSLGHDICQYIPLDRGAFELEGPRLTTWLKGWMGTDFSPPLEPVDWYREGHKPGTHLWAPPPAAALVSLKQLAKSRHKRPHSVTHVFVCQRLLWQERWRRRFEKEMDVWFILHSGLYWPHDLFEPLLVGISFPMLRREQGPWLVRQEREQVVEVGRTLSELSKSCHVQVGNYLCKLWEDPWQLPSM